MASHVDIPWSTTIDPDWLEGFLLDIGLCRIATIRVDRGPHLTPTGFLWDGSSIWIASQIQTQRFVDLKRDPRCAVLVEGPDPMVDGYVEIFGDAEVVGAVPSVSAETAELRAIETLWMEKMGFTLDLVHDGAHAWVKVFARRIVRVQSVIVAHDDQAYIEASVDARRHQRERSVTTDQPS